MSPSKKSPIKRLPNLPVLDQDGGAARRRARRTCAGRAAVGGLPGAARRAEQARGTYLAVTRPIPRSLQAQPAMQAG